jgi:hypothetical protein
MTTIKLVLWHTQGLIKRTRELLRTSKEVIRQSQPGRSELKQSLPDCINAELQEQPTKLKFYQPGQ